MSLNSDCKNIVGNEWVIDDIKTLNHYSHDQSFVPPSQPELVTFPKSVEEVKLKGMPLGGVANFPYKDEKLELNRGDTILFLSDGFEEMFNHENEMLGGERARKLFQEVGYSSPKRIIEHIKTAGKN